MTRKRINPLRKGKRAELQACDAIGTALGCKAQRGQQRLLRLKNSRSFAERLMKSSS